MGDANNSTANRIPNNNDNIDINAATTTTTGNEQTESEKRSLRAAIRSTVGIVILYSIAFFCWNMALVPHHFKKVKSQSLSNSTSTTAAPMFSQTTLGYFHIAELVVGFLLTLTAATLFFVGTSKSKNDQDPVKCILFLKIALIVMILQCGFAFLNLIVDPDPDEKKTAADTWRILGYALFQALFSTVLVLLRERFKKLLQPPIQILDPAAVAAAVNAVRNPPVLPQQGQSPAVSSNANEAPVAQSVESN